jgi:Caspase domain
MRYGLIICSAETLIEGGASLTPEMVKAVSQRWAEKIGKAGPLKNFGFGWQDGRKNPRILRSALKKGQQSENGSEPSRANIFSAIDELDVQLDDELFFYYYGHAYPFQSNGVTLALRNARLNDDAFTFTTFVEEFINKGFRKIYFVLDTCHAGRNRKAISSFQNEVYGVFASSDGDYARKKPSDDGGVLSESLLTQLDLSRLDGSSGRDRLLNRKKRGITFTNWFSAAKNDISPSSLKHLQSDPLIYGGADIGDNLLISYSPTIPDGVNEFAPRRSIYCKLHAILVGLRGSARYISFQELYRKLVRERAFWIRDQGPAGKPEFVSPTRIRELIDYLIRLGFVELDRKTTKRDAEEKLTLTESGEVAANEGQFNNSLLRAIEAHIFPEGVSIDYIRQITFNLMDEAEIPNTFFVADRLRRLGIRINDEKAFKMSFLVLPYTRKFRKVTTDTIFPSYI